MCVQRFISVLEEREATHQEFELAEGDGGAVEEIGRQPSFVFIAVSDSRA